MEKYLTTYAILLGLTSWINLLGFIGIYSLLKKRDKKEICKDENMRNK